ncbi:hypothetical protein M5K25_024472 [Dendrobium thyrsiflorum]|uniref:Acid phosphatase/vanadium-dependent haloperoxidase-related protein n=1 Tax=Dendrobium thyrsiflorum TaxID=117978 RepID=A0ABD0U288_DENTH
MDMNLDLQLNPTQFSRESYLPKNEFIAFPLRNCDLIPLEEATRCRHLPCHTCFSSPPPSRKKKKPILSFNRRSLTCVSAFKVGAEEIAELAKNKVLVASTLSYAIGQLSKSFASAFNGDGIELKAAVRSGGMPSVHSASVVAAATSLALDRGFSDPIFGMSVVFASLVMYDAQGVRREVGYHAKILNELLKAQDLISKSDTSSINSGESGSVFSDLENANNCIEKTKTYSLLKSGITLSNLETLQSLKVDVKEASHKSESSCSPLNESVGHTEIQVLAGGLLGFIISLMVNSII